MLLKEVIAVCLKLRALFVLPLKPPIASFFSMRLQGGALYVAIIVSIIMGVMLSLFILLANYNQRTVTVYLQSTQLYYNLQSAFEMAQSSYFNEAMNNTWIKNAVNDDSIKINKCYWGAYVLLSVKTKNRHQLLSQSGLYGTAMTSDTGLVISDNSRPIGVSGMITLKANCYLPKAGIKPTYIEGQNYISAPENSSFIKVKSGTIPELQQTLIQGLKQQRSGNNTNTDSSINILPEALNHPFSEKTIVYTTASKSLSHLSLSNNIKIIAGDVEIDSTCRLNNILLICKKARFKEGFHGNIHVIASDSITTGKNCMFQFPSSFVVLPEDNSTNSLSYMQLNENCKFFGGLLAVDPDNTGKTKVLIKLHPKSEINGLAYSCDYIHLEGQVNATVICNKLLLKTPSAVYENQMLGCVIDPKKYGSSMAVPSLFSSKIKLMCCQKIN